MLAAGDNTILFNVNTASGLNQTIKAVVWVLLGGVWTAVGEVYSNIITQGATYIRTAPLDLTTPYPKVSGHITQAKIVLVVGGGLTLVTFGAGNLTLVGLQGV
jgi:hypothetical protein